MADRDRIVEARMKLSERSDLTPERWHLRVDGACRNPLQLIQR